MTMELTNLFDRAVEVAAAPAASAIKQRLAQTATEFNLAGHMEAHLGIATSAIAALISVLYATEADGRPANYDSATYRILLRPLPWGEVRRRSLAVAPMGGPVPAPSTH
jgi:hypothetical protein